MSEPRYGILIPAYGNCKAMVLAQDDRSELLKGVDSEVVMFKNMAKYPGVGSNGGTAAGLVGSDETVANLAEFTKVGVGVIGKKLCAIDSLGTI
ncbi:luciferase-like protein [Nostoc linckia NIES-25]|nr:luciferase-like protein [Nostoc linckia NIES-25]